MRIEIWEESDYESVGVNGRMSFRFFCSVLVGANVHRNPTRYLKYISVFHQFWAESSMIRPISSVQFGFTCRVGFCRFLLTPTSNCITIKKGGGSSSPCYHDVKMKNMYSTIKRQYWTVEGNLDKEIQFYCLFRGKLYFQPTLRNVYPLIALIVWFRS